jgi:hypothetical protein
MNQITKRAALLCPSVLAGALLVAGLSTGCGDWAKDQACWSASNEGYGACLAKG